MKLSQLLFQRDALQRQTRLANLAYAYRQLDNLVTRISAARLRGEVCLRPAEPDSERFWPTLTALEGSQSVIEEHFSDEGTMELADLISFITGRENAATTFRLEEMAARWLVPLQLRLERAGVEFEPQAPRLARPRGNDREA